MAQVRPSPDSVLGTVAAYKAELAAARTSLFARYDRGEPVTDLVSGWSRDIDRLVAAAWRRFVPAAESAAVVAVGGYGREELHPKSDTSARW